MFADVIIDIQHEKLDKIFQYRIPERLEHEVEAGMAVVVPFGKGNRKTKGYVTALSKTCDYDISKEPGKEHSGMAGMKMPACYVAEMFVDRISASKNYQKDKYTDRSALDYYMHGRSHYLIHPDTEALIHYLLLMLAVRGEKETFAFVKNEVLKGNVPYERESLIRRIQELAPEEKI